MRPNGIQLFLPPLAWSEYRWQKAFSQNIKSIFNFLAALFYFMYYFTKKVFINKNQKPVCHEGGAFFWFSALKQNKNTIGFIFGVPMPWIRMPGIEGLLYEPQKQPSIDRKHNCQDCYFCQNCSDVRCTVCRECGNPTSTSEAGAENPKKSRW